MTFPIIQYVLHRSIYRSHSSQNYHFTSRQWLYLYAFASLTWSPCVDAFTHISHRPQVNQEFSGAYSDRSTPIGTIISLPPIQDVIPSRYDCRTDFFQTSVIVDHQGLSTILPGPPRPTLRQSKASIPTTGYHDLTCSLFQRDPSSTLPPCLSQDLLPPSS